jgi:HEAT repeat protein
LRGCIAEALGILGERSVASQLVTLLTDGQIDWLWRGNIAEALGTLGERSVAPQLVTLLTDERVDQYVRWSIADAMVALGEVSVVPELLELLAKGQDDDIMCRSVADALALLIDNEKDVKFLANLFIDSNKDIADDIYRALWTASRRVGVRVLVRNEAGKQRLEVVRR